jgi:hypothetical protein
MLRFGGQEGNVNSLTKAAILKVFADLEAAGGLLDGLELRLFTAGPTPGPDVAYGHYTQATFSGYAPITALTWEIPSYEDGSAQVVSMDPVPIFNHSGGGTANDVEGFLLTTTAGAVTTLWYAEKFPEAITMAALGDQIVIPPVIRIDGTV